MNSLNRKLTLQTIVNLRLLLLSAIIAFLFGIVWLGWFNLFNFKINQAAAATISGTIYQADESTVDATGYTVKLSVGGAAALSDVTADETFSIDATVSDGDYVTIWLDTNGGTQASLVFRYGSSCTGYTDCTGLVLVANQVRVQNFDTGAVSITDMSVCDNDSGAGCSDTDIGFLAEADLELTWSTNKLKIASGTVFSPGGDTTQQMLDIAGTFSASNYTHTLYGEGGGGGGSGGVVTHVSSNVAQYLASLSTPISHSFTVSSGNDRLLLVGITHAFQGTTGITSVTYNGDSLTFLDEHTYTSGRYIHWYYLLNPDVGTYNINITLFGPNDNYIVGANSFTGVNQSTPFGTVAKATGSNSTPTVNVSSATGELVFDTVMVHQTGSPTGSADASQTQLYFHVPASAIPRHGASVEAGDTSVTMSWALSRNVSWGIMGVSIKPAASSGGGSGGTGLPLSVTGTLSEDSSTFVYAGGDTLQILPETYHNLTIAPVEDDATNIVNSGTVFVAGDLILGNGTNTGIVIDALTNDAGLDVDGDFTISAGTTFSASDSAALEVGGSWANAGTFTHNNNTVTFTATSTGQTITDGGSDWYNLEFDGNGGGWSFADSTVIAGELTVTDGTLSGTNDISVSGANIAGNGTIDLTGGTFTANGSGDFGGDSSWTFYNLDLNGDSIATGSGDVAITNMLTVDGSLDGGSKTWTLSGTGTPFSGSGTFTASASTVNYTGGDSTVVKSGTYYNLGVLPGVNNATHVLASGTFTINNTLTLGNGTNTAVTISANANDPVIDVNGSGGLVINSNSTFIAPPSSSLTVAGSWVNSGSFAHNGNPVTLDSTASGRTLQSGGSSFDDLIINGSGGVWTLADALQIDGDLTLTAGTLEGAYDVTVAGGAVTGDGVINLTGGTFTVSGTGDFGGESDWTFDNLTFGSNDGSGWCNIGSGGDAAGDCNSNWGARRQITFDNSASSEDLVNFPVLVQLSTANIDYDKVQSAGEDLRFVDSDGSLLDHEIELWNESGTSYVWVRVPQIDSGSTTDYIWMYYDNASASDGQDAAGVWDSDYKGVWHLSDNSGTGITESTSNSNDGTKLSATEPSVNTSSKIGNGQTFDGVDDIITVADHDSLDTTSEVTISAWIYAESWNNDFGGAIVNKEGNYYLRSGDNASTQFDMGWFNSSTMIRVSRSSAPSTDAWHHVVGVAQSNDAFEIYQNGVAVGSAPFNWFASSRNLNFDLIIGGSGDPGFHGVLDEVRVSTIARSAEWLEAEYLFTADNTKYTYGSEDTGAITGTITGVGGGNIIVSGDLTIISGTTFEASDVTISIGGNWDSQGVFTANSSTVEFAPSSEGATINVATDANLDFYDFTVSVPGTIVRFENGFTYDFSNQLTLAGTGSKPIIITSDSSGVDWTVTLNIADLTFVKVRDAACSGGNTVTGIGLVDLGNNGACWIFTRFNHGGGGNAPVDGGVPGGSGGTSGGTSGGGIATATASAQVSDGIVISITITSGGSGYTIAPTILVCSVGGAGSGAAATATISSGSVDDVSVTNGGSGYLNGATVNIGSPSNPQGAGGCGGQSGGSQGSGGGGASP